MIENNPVRVLIVLLSFVLVASVEPSTTLEVLSEILDGVNTNCYNFIHDNSEDLELEKLPRNQAQMLQSLGQVQTSKCQVVVIWLSNSTEAENLFDSGVLARGATKFIYVISLRDQNGLEVPKFFDKVTDLVLIDPDTLQVSFQHSCMMLLYS